MVVPSTATMVSGAALDRSAARRGRGARRAEYCEADHEHMLAAACDEARRGGHRRQIRAEVDDIGHEKDGDEQPDDALGKGADEVVGEADAGDPADMRA